MKELEIEGNISFQKNGGPEKLEERTIRLLEAVHGGGSIVKTAKAVRVSYKTAWDILNRANNLAEEPLVRKTVGGSGGGYTTLTEAGHRLLRQYRIVKEEYSKYLRALAGRIDHADQILNYLRRMSMRISARNILSGTVKSVKLGQVNAEVTLSLPGGETIAAVITPGSVSDLGLAAGVPAYAIIKASAILLAVGLQPRKISARNVLAGKVISLTEGAVNAEVTVALSGETTLCAVITRESARNLALAEGMEVSAIFKASSVIVGVL